MEPSPLFELRTDPIMGRKVYISEGRAGRPSDYSDVEKQIGQRATDNAAAHCPFCAGHESETPVTSAEHCDQNGNWRVRVFPNKYPAVHSLGDALPNFDELENGTSQSPRGHHEVIVESREHLHEISELSLEQCTVVLQVYRDRVKHWIDTPGVQQVLLFKNSGFAAGASLSHLHSQLIAVPHGLSSLEAELDGAEDFYRKVGRCVFCDLVDRETTDGTRIVDENDRYVAFCAFAGRQPFETWILPKSHSANFHLMSENDLEPLAEILLELVDRLQSCLSPLTYNLVLHTAPATGQYEAAYHWHWELIPRSTRLAGLEFGGGAHINPLSPERAASFLRKAKC